jgi:AraC-like DNA-binding protein
MHSMGSAFVQDVSIMQLQHASQYVMRVPDGSATLLLRMTHGDLRSKSRAGDLTAAGPRTRTLYKQVPAVALVLSIQLRPGAAYTLFGVPTRELTDRFVRLQDVWGSAAARMCDEALVGASPALVAARLVALLHERFVREEEPLAATLARRAVDLIARAHGSVRIDTVAARLGVTGRHLRRVFREVIGVGPKDYARMMRFKLALELQAGGQSWSRVAAQVGYCDQAHLIADFADLTGVTPSAFVARRQAAIW